MERLYLDRTDVHLLVEGFGADDAGRVCCVVYEHSAGRQYASELAARFRVPIRPGSAQDMNRDADGRRNEIA
jgi:hypothetical protein